MAIQNAINSVLGSIQSGIGISKVIKGQERENELREQGNEKHDAEIKALGAQTQAMEAQKALQEKQLSEIEKNNKAAEEKTRQEELSNRVKTMQEDVKEEKPYYAEMQKAAQNLRAEAAKDFSNSIYSSDSMQQEVHLDKAQNAYDTAYGRLQMYKNAVPTQLRQKYINGEIKSYKDYQEQLQKFQLDQIKSNQHWNELYSKLHNEGLTPDRIVDEILGFIDEQGNPTSKVTEMEEAAEEFRKGESDAQSEEAEAQENNNRR